MSCLFGKAEDRFSRDKALMNILSEKQIKRLLDAIVIGVVHILPPPFNCDFCLCHLSWMAYDEISFFFSFLLCFHHRLNQHLC